MMKPSELALDILRKQMRLSDTTQLVTMSRCFEKLAAIALEQAVLWTRSSSQGSVDPSVMADILLQLGEPDSDTKK